MKFFCFERIFLVDRAFWRWNGHCTVSSNKEVHHTITSKYPAGVMSICVVSDDGNVLNCFFAGHTKI